VFTVTDGYRGSSFFVTEDGAFKVTPLFVVLAVIELSDVIFAVDSIPAVFGVTLDPVVIYASNMAAILSLRAMFGFVSTVIAELRCAPRALRNAACFARPCILIYVCELCQSNQRSNGDDDAGSATRMRSGACSLKRFEAYTARMPRSVSKAAACLCQQASAAEASC
jgi:Integral membrane protein TerC family